MQWTKEQFLDKFSIITTNYTQQWLKLSNDEKNKYYYNWKKLLEPYSIDLIEKSFLETVKHCKYLPTFNDIYIELCAIKNAEEKEKNAENNSQTLRFNTENYSEIKRKMIAEKQRKADALYHGCETTEQVIKRTQQLIAESGFNIQINYNVEDEYF